MTAHSVLARIRKCEIHMCRAACHHPHPRYDSLYADHGGRIIQPKIVYVKKNDKHEVCASPVILLQHIVQSSCPYQQLCCFPQCVWQQKKQMNGMKREQIVLAMY